MKKTSKRKAKSKKQLMFMRSRRGVILVALIAVMVLIINLISASYSWFTPENVNGTGMKYDYESKARSENCTMSTYKGVKVTGNNGNGQTHAGYYLNQIHYDSSATTSNVSIASGATQYFKTEIINQDTKNASGISLYITGISGVNASNTCTMAVTYPSNSVRTLTTSGTNFIIRNAYVKRKDAQDVNGPGLLVVEWFVTNNGSSSISVNPSNLYLTYS